MEAKQMLTTSGSMLCLINERGTIIGWIPYPLSRDAVGLGRETVYLARPTSLDAQQTPRAA